MRVALALLIVHAGLSPLVFSAGLNDSFELPKSLLLLATAIALVGVGLVGALEHRGGFVRASASISRDPLLWSGLGLLASSLLSSLAGRHPIPSLIGVYSSFAGFAWVTSLGVLLLTARLLPRPERTFRALACAVALSTSGMLGYAVLQKVGADPVAWSWQPSIRGTLRVFSTMGHPNFLADALVLGLPLLLAQGVLFWWRGSKWVGSAMLALGLAASLLVVATLSRAGLLALAAVAGVAFLAGASERVGLWRARWALVGGIVLLLGAGFLLAPQLPELAERWQSLGRDGRVEIWRAAFRMFSQHPWIGVGTDGFGPAFPVARDAAYWDIEFGRNATRAHSGPIQLLATQGIVGGVAGAAFCLCVVWSLARAWRRAASREVSLVVAALGATCVAFAVRGLFGFTTSTPASLFACQAGILAALAWGGAEGVAPQVADPFRFRWLVRGAVGIAVAVSLGALVVNPIFADAHALEGRRSLARGSLVEASRALGLAVERAPLRSVYWGYLAESRHRAAEKADEPARTSLLREASGLHTRAIDLAPWDAWHRARRAMVYADLARTPGSGVGWPDVEALLADAIQRAPHDVILLSEASRVALALGHPAEASAYAERSVTIHPDFARGWRALGLAEISRGQREQAIAHLSRALEERWHGDDDGREETKRMREGLRRAR